MTDHADARADLFQPGTELPTRAAVLNHPEAGQSARDLAEALFDRDLSRAQRMLAQDPVLARVRIGERGDMLCVAVATGSTAAIDLLLAYGAPPSGDGGSALELALAALDPQLAHYLLMAGASPSPADDPAGPLATATALNSVGAVQMLLDFGADPNAASADRPPPLLTALYMETFRIAELLLARGANPWAFDATGGNLGSASIAQMITSDPVELAAQQRLVARLTAIGWPFPAPTPADVRALTAAGRWPPP